jgi:esterase/lipase superfamily enzyme
MKRTETWHSSRLEQEITAVRWGETGIPVLIFPTAGGDAEEIERFLIIQTLAPFLDAGRIKVYSCDSLAGQAMLAGEGSPQHQMAMINRYQQYIGEELVPMIRADCRSEDIGVVAAGASIGAFTALAALCRYPEAFTHAMCLSGTFDLSRFVDAPITGDFYVSSPVHYLPELHGPGLEAIQRRFILLASGEGRAEDIGESWRVANVLGQKGIPNRVDSWGPDWHHDWPTWRNMLHKYLDELAP